MSEMEQPPVYKIALGIEYDGSKYYGWQRQNEVRSVQEKAPMIRPAKVGPITGANMITRPADRKSVV